MLRLLIQKRKERSSLLPSTSSSIMPNFSKASFSSSLSCSKPWRVLKSSATKMVKSLELPETISEGRTRAGVPIDSAFLIVASALLTRSLSLKAARLHLSLSKLLRTWVRATESLRSEPRLATYFSTPTFLRWKFNQRIRIASGGNLSKS